MAASSPPATPVMNEASAKAQSLYSVVLMPAASAAGSLWRMTSHERPTLLRMCQSTSRNIAAATTTE